jgi:hypothetical protein
VKERYIEERGAESILTKIIDRDIVVITTILRR